MSEPEESLNNEIRKLKERVKALEAAARRAKRDHARLEKRQGVIKIREWEGQMRARRQWG